MKNIVLFLFATIILIGCRSHKNASKNSESEFKSANKKLEKPKALIKATDSLVYFTNENRVQYHFADSELIRANGVGPFFYNKDEIKLQVTINGITEVIKIPAYTRGRTVRVATDKHLLVVIFDDERPIEITCGTAEADPAYHVLSIFDKNNEAIVKDGVKLPFLRYNGNIYSFLAGKGTYILVEPSMFKNREYVAKGVK